MDLIDYDRKQNVCRTLGGDAVRGSHSDKYRGVRLSARGEKVEPVERKVDRAFTTLATLKLSKALVRGMELMLATEMHTASLEAK